MIKAQRVTRHNPFLTQPDFSTHREIPRPATKLIGETISDKVYTEAELVEFVLAAKDTLFGITIDPTKLDNLPEDYLRNLYVNVRYGLSRPNAIPLRDGVRGDFITVPFTVYDYLLCSMIFTGIYETNIHGLLPDNKYEAKVAHDYLTMFAYLTHKMYRDSADITQVTTDSIVAATTTTWKIGSGEQQVTETEHMVYINAFYPPTTNSDQQAAEQWVNERVMAS